MEAKYTLDEWIKNKRKRKCPWCGVVGLYWHWEDGKRNYRLCKWCGIMQNVGEPLQQLTLVGCKKCGSSGIWTTTPETKRCWRCDGKMTIMKNPKDDL